MNRAAAPVTAIDAQGGGTPAGTKPAWRRAAAAPFGYLRLRKEGVRRALNSEHYAGEKSRGAAWQFLFRQAEKAIGGANEPVIVGRVLYVHPSLHPCLSEPMNKADKLARESRDRRAIVAARIAALRAVGGYVRVNGSRLGGKVKAVAEFCAERGGRFAYQDGRAEVTIAISPRSLDRWERDYRSGGADALVDGRGRFTRADGLSEEAVKLHWTLRHDPRRFSIRQVWRLVKLEAKEQGWAYFPKYSTCAAWDKRTRNERALILNQRGDLKYAQVAGRYIEQDEESFEPGECFVGDNTTADAWVIMPNGDICRPVGSFWVDARSRAIVGWRFTRAASEHSLMASFRDGAERFGLPGHVIVDNGKDFKAWSFTGGKVRSCTQPRSRDTIEAAEGIFQLCGIALHPSTPYNPNSKAIERWFRTFSEQCMKTLPSYCGGCAEDRPEDHAALAAKAIPFVDFIAHVERYVSQFNNTPHSGAGMNGRTPLQVLATARTKRLMSDEVRDLCLQTWVRPLKLGRNGVRVRIAGAALGFGWDEPALRALPIGTSLRIGYDPEDLRSVTVWTLDYGFVCRARANRKFNRKVAGEDLRQALREIRAEKRALREVRKAGLDYLRDPMERTLAALAADADERRLPDPPGPEGGPILVPIRTPIEAPSKSVQPLRKAVGAEVGAADAAASVNPDGDFSDMQQRFAALAEKSRADRAARATESVYDRLGQFVRGSGK